MKFKALWLLFIGVVSTGFAQQKGKTQNIVIVTIDGCRIDFRSEFVKQ